MSFTKFAVVVVVVALVRIDALGAPMIDVGHHDLQPNLSGQEIRLYVHGGDVIKGVTLNVQIGDGETGPIITDVNLVDGTPFMGNSLGHSFGWGPGEGAVSVGTTTLTGSVNAGGATNAAKQLLAVLTIDTTGFFEGTFDLTVAETLDGKTRFADASSLPLLPTVTNGSMTIVPESVSLALLSLGSVAMLSRRRRGGIAALQTACPLGRH